jgi:ribosomal-protein-alanine N-acetyltransferase
LERGQDQAGTIRGATPNEIPSILALERSATGVARWSERAYRDALGPGAPERVVLVYEVEGVIKGFLIARFSAYECEIENIVVLAECRRFGIGLRLITNLISVCRDRRLQGILLEVRESNSGARSLYSRCGFAESGRRKLYYSDPAEDAVLYSLAL